jgi:hypothetical protein
VYLVIARRPQVDREGIWKVIGFPLCEKVSFIRRCEVLKLWVTELMPTSATSTTGEESAICAETMSPYESYKPFNWVQERLPTSGWPEETVKKT